MTDSISYFVDVSLRSSFLLVMIFAVLLAMKKASAAERHLVLLLSLIVMVLMPVIALVSPKIRIPLFSLQPTETKQFVQMVDASHMNQVPMVIPAISSIDGENQFSSGRVIAWGDILVFALVTGMAIQIVFLGRAAWAWRNIRCATIEACLPDEVLRRVRAFAGAKGIPLIFFSEQRRIPLLAGWWNPVIILPLEARDWSVERLTMVLCHEIAHFRRGDSRVLPLTALLRVVYWWHPLVWMALDRLRRERESACDDLVLNQNIPATDYADLIIITAREARAVAGWSAVALAMASSSSFSNRISSILDPSLRRKSASRTTFFAGAVFILALGWFFGAAQVQAQDKLVTSSSTGLANDSKQQIQLEFKLITIDEKTYIKKREEIDAAVSQSDLLSLLKLKGKGVSILAAPSVTTQNGVRAAIDVTREISYPIEFDKDKEGKQVPSDFKTRNVGLSIEAVPNLEADKQVICLKLKCRLTSFVGWKDISSRARLPTFDTVGLSTERLFVDSCIFWIGPTTTRAQLPSQSDDGSFTNDISPKRVLLFASAHPVSLSQGR